MPNITYNNIFFYIDEPEIPKINPITIIFETTSQKTVIINIDSNKKMKELIKFYFQIIKKPELYNVKSIAFLINGNAIEHQSEDLIKNVINNEANKILVADTEDKMKFSIIIIH